VTDAERLTRWLEHKRIAVLTGAGCSTESGIPDYRGPETARRARTPIQGRAFATDPVVRARYWARALVGFRRFEGARPNAAHRALATLEHRGTVRGVITQNVDGLHGAAGSRRVVELHGSLAEVACLDCGVAEPRAGVQARLEAGNPRLLAAEAGLAPDGDADLPDALLSDFVVPVCLACEGRIKPRVVFFGENVPKPVVDAAFDLLAGAEGLLVVGTSLAVFSGYRFVLRARDRGIPMCFVNLGRARGDDLAELRFDARAGSLLGAAVAT
jgi:NAD-dependent SIR2 family protein deacetylase